MSHDSRVQPSPSLRDVLNDWDPIGVRPGRPGGAPEDEYDCLNRELVPLLERVASPQEVLELLRDGLRTHFGLDPALATPDVAARIVALGTSS